MTSDPSCTLMNRFMFLIGSVYFAIRGKSTTGSILPLDNMSG